MTPPRQFFVDEAGDPVLFDRKGRSLVGTPGCSRHFIVGLLDVEDEASLQRELEALRAHLLADPYFRGVPSMQPSSGRTALAFHAKDDPAEVRWQVLQLLARHELSFAALVRDKREVLTYVEGRGAVDPIYRYRPDELYDHSARQLFKERLHTHDAYRICFASRGSRSRTQALRAQVEMARDRFDKKVDLQRRARIEVVEGRPESSAGLQAVDYFLWALQRVFERGEDRFLGVLSHACSLIVDADDRRLKGYGEFYSKKRPLTAAACSRDRGI